MTYTHTHEDLKSLILNPRECLTIEIKQWIDPSTLEGIAKIAKACIALYNNDGGCFIVGFTDTGIPDLTNVPKDVRTRFHADTIQRIVSKYASFPFEVKVEFVERDGIEYPVICVPRGVKYPVAAKADLLDSNGRFLIKVEVVYVRSLNANNIASSTAARRGDWPRVAQICCRNYEVDVGAFLSKRLSGKGCLL